MSFLDRRHSVAPMQFNRWLVPPAALAVHLSIGQIYAYSVFNAPLTKLIGITHSAPEDWALATVGWVFSIALAVLGASAALFGTWMERVGPRKAMFVAACCFGAGFLVAAFGVHVHNIWLVYLGNGVIGGVGLGLGYIGPVSTLMKWFPDKPGMATGLACCISRSCCSACSPSASPQKAGNRRATLHRRARLKQAARKTSARPQR